MSLSEEASRCRLTVNTIPVDFAELGEGRYRAQLLATDQDGLTSALVPDNAYDTIVDDISAPDFSEHQSRL